MYDQVFDAPIVHLGGTGLLKKLDGPRSVALLREAKARNRIVTFDLIAASAETAGIVLPLLPYIDYFMPSIEEARDMSGCADPGDCAAFYLPTPSMWWTLLDAATGSTPASSRRSTTA
jgi:sugar/nucleoside kinase (ribokinase family)